MVSVSATPSAPSNSSSYKPSSARSWTTITSITTKTVHPTYLFILTESELVSNLVTSSFVTSGVATSGALEKSSQTARPPSPTPMNMSTTLTGSSTVVTSVMDAPLSSMKPFAPLATLSDFNSLEISQSESTYFGQPEATTTSTSSVSTSNVKSVSSSATSVSPTVSPFVDTATATITTDTSTSSTTALFIGAVSSTISTNSPATSSNSTSASHPEHGNAIKPAVIAGTIIGASAFLMIAIAACFILRRRRQKITKLQKIIGARMECLSLGPGAGYETLRCPPAATPGTDSKPKQTPTLPVIPEEAHIFPAYSNGPFTPAHAHSNPDLSLDSLYLRSERSRCAFYTQNAVTAVHQTEPSPSLAVHVSPPSPRTSAYSRSSWEDESVDIFDFYGDSIATLPHEHDGVIFSSSNAKYLEACMSRDSLRSNPFDLEAPSVSNPARSPPVPPVPTEWGTKF